MASNRLPKTVAEILDLATRCKLALAAHGVDLEILQYTAATLGAKITALEGKQLTYNTSRSVHAATYQPMHVQSGLLRDACLDARKLLSIPLGDDWTPAWIDPGWTKQTTEVPTNIGELKALGTSLKTFLTANADYQVDTPKITFTPARFAGILTALDPLLTAVTEKALAQALARDDRKAEVKALTKDLRGLIELLTGKLDPNSPLWDVFGLNRPGATVLPGIAAMPSLTKISAGKVLAQTAPVSLATYYRWFAQLVGVDADFRFLGRSQDSMFELLDQPATGTLKVKVQAANEAGPSKASAVATIVLN